jgi:hydrogenase large subunit
MTVNGDYTNGVSVMDRHLARAYEALKIASAMQTWLNALPVDVTAYTPVQKPDTGSGVGLTEAPRGALGHWVTIRGGRIANYQCVVPTTWNAAPRDEKGNPSPYEAALPGHSLAVPDQPLEILRTVHSFNPCMACAVHLMSPEGEETLRVQVL